MKSPGKICESTKPSREYLTMMLLLRIMENTIKNMSKGWLELEFSGTPVG